MLRGRLAHEVHDPRRILDHALPLLRTLQSLVPGYSRAKTMRTGFVRTENGSRDYGTSIYKPCISSFSQVPNGDGSFCQGCSSGRKMERVENFLSEVCRTLVFPSPGKRDRAGVWRSLRDRRTSSLHAGMTRLSRGQVTPSRRRGGDSRWARSC